MQKHTDIARRFSHGLFQFSDPQRKKELLYKAGQKLEDTVNNAMETRGLEAPVLENDFLPFQWYRVPLKKGLSGDGSEYHIYLRRGDTSKLCIFFSGGGLAWNSYTAAHPINTGAQVSWEPNYYYDNLRPVTEIMNIGSGIMENNPDRNPFYHWNFAVVTYATGDFHIGRNDYTYTDEDGLSHTLHFHGWTNFIESMNKAKQYFPSVDQLLLAGDSAGGFAVPSLASDIADHWYPGCSDITVLSDSSLLIYEKWKTTVRDLWKAEPSKYECIVSDNIVLDWYSDLIRRNRHRFQCLYCGSTHDYILSTYYNDVTNKQYGTDSEVQQAFYEQLNHMIAGFRMLDSSFGIFIHNMKNPMTKGGTVHTSVRKPWFYARLNDTSICQWLKEAVIDHNVQCCGLQLL